MERLGAREGDHQEPGSEKPILENPEDEVQVRVQGVRDQVPEPPYPQSRHSKKLFKCLLKSEIRRVYKTCSLKNV